VNLLFLTKFKVSNRGQKSLTVFQQLFNGILKKVKFKKIKVTPPEGFEPEHLGFETTEHLCNMMRKENCQQY